MKEEAEAEAEEEEKEAKGSCAQPTGAWMRLSPAGIGAETKPPKSSDAALSEGPEEKTETTGEGPSRRSTRSP